MNSRKRNVHNHYRAGMLAARCDLVITMSCVRGRLVGQWVMQAYWNDITDDGIKQAFMSSFFRNGEFVEYVPPPANDEESSVSGILTCYTSNTTY